MRPAGLAFQPSAGLPSVGVLKRRNLKMLDRASFALYILIDG